MRTRLNRKQQKTRTHCSSSNGIATVSPFSLLLPFLQAKTSPPLLQRHHTFKPFAKAASTVFIPVKQKLNLVFSAQEIIL
ncbi:hypothetical protein [Shouchella clausii]|uniref:hypothetical protein n=1 Tax=Shouchella clausii TaxID=79880 RepID=UPI0005A058CC|nr:hypothetical protein [Shouchella clausii]MBX0319514.1 hypothetical protein [Shouchella clausii]